MKIHGWNGSKVAVSLREVRTTSDVFWSKRSNSFVLAEVIPSLSGKVPDGFLVNGTKCSLVSINGGGEVRWEISPREVASALRTEKAMSPADFAGVDASETLAAARHFGLI